MRKNKIYKRLGYSADREGLLRRYFNEKNAWQAHLENTKQFILDEMPQGKGGRCLTVGSGWWLDVPIDELSEKFDELILVDITHPAQIRKKSAEYPNMQIVTGDITALSEPVYKYVKKNKRRSRPEDLSEMIASAMPLSLLDIPPADYYVSVNLLSQLTVFPRDFLLKKTSLTGEHIRHLEKEIQTAHLNLFPPEKSVYITDYREHCFDKQTGGETVRELIFVDWPTQRERRQWQWDFDLSGNYKQCQKTILDVAAFGRDLR